ncbi:MAG: Flp family type IVb pilin [Pseudomonadota bacterium]
MNMIKNFVRDESGATAIEYGLMASLIALLIIGAVTAIGSDLFTVFDEINKGLNTTPKAAS